ncbi:hypothetical protein M885DRAFT_544527 [Pelagophyceae sp. CCMP2097]|nr:hypothetical protein M885DRAFT_544527 [Pelagophyceae sp. CCMP2097]
MRATLASAFVEISKPTVTFITFNVAPPPPKLKPQPEVVEDEKAPARARSSSLLQSAGCALNALPEKNDMNNILLSVSLWFNALVDLLEASGLAFAKGDVHKPDGPGYRFVLVFSQLLNQLDGHHPKFEKSNCALPDAEIFRLTFRKTATNPVPPLSTERIKALAHDLPCAMKRGAWAKDPSWCPMLAVVSLAIEALQRHCGKREETWKTVSARHEALRVARDATTEGKIVMVPYSEHVIPRYARLDAELQKVPHYTPALVDDSYYDDSAGGLHRRRGPAGGGEVKATFSTISSS